MKKRSSPKQELSEGEKIEKLLEGNSQEFRRNAQLLEASQAIAKVGGWELDLTTKHLYWTAETYRIHDTSPEEFNPTVDAGVGYFLPESKRQISEALELAMTKGIGYDLYLETYTTKGRKIEVRTTCLVTVVDGKPTKLTGIFHDITEQKRKEAEIATISKEISDITNAVNEGTALSITSAQGIFVKVNKQLCELSGYTEEELIGQNHNILNTDYHDAAFWRNQSETIMAGKTWKGEIKKKKKDGSDYWVNSVIQPICNDSGQVVQFLSIRQDITKRKKAELELTKTKDFLLQTSRVAQVGGWDFDNLTGEISWSDVICDIHEVPHGFVPTYEQMANFYTPESWEQLEKAIHKALTNGTPYDLEEQIITAKGKLCWVRAIGSSEFKDGKCVRLFGILQDINDRKKAELVLQESEKKFRGLFENLIDEVHLWKIVKDKTGKITGWLLVDANPSALKSWGKSINEVIGKTANEIFGADAHAQFMPIVEEIFKTYKPYHWENYFSPTGQYLQMESIPFGDYFISTGKDITEQKKSEQALKDSELRLTSIFENSPAFIFEVDTDFNYTFLNKIQSGLKVEDIIGHSIFEFVPEEFKEPYRDLYDNAIETGLPQSAEILGVGSFGESSWYSVTINPLLRSGVLTGFIGISNDITALKKAEIELREGELRLSLATQAGGVGVWDLDIVANKLTWDDQMFALYGVKREAFTSAPDVWTQGVYEADREQSNKEAELAIKGEKEFKTEFRVQHPNGDIRNIRALATVVRDPQGNAIRMIGTNWDITKEKEALRQIEEAREQAEAASKAKSEFLANMSHEIRTPLNGVIGFTELLTKTPLNPVQQQYANSANVSGHTLLGIINDILDFSKIEAGMLELEVMKTDMVELLENSIDIVKFSAANKEFELLLDIDPSMPRFAHIDSIRTQQILANLLSNAVKFTQKGEVALKAVYQALDGNQGKLSISVRDTGIGISEEQKAKLFKSFSQADSSTTRKFGGTGLGLIISQMIAEKMESKINIDSTPDVGSTFFFDIITHFEEGEKLDTTQIAGVKRCLIIDDNDNNRLILEQMLKQWQIESDSCNNGLEALQKLQNSQPYDVIICDYVMPYLNGIETIGLMKDKLKLSTEKHPIILLHSSLDNRELNQKSKELGIRFRLNKPVKSQDLFTYLSQLDQTTETNPQKESEQTVNVSHTSEKIKILIAEDNPLNMVLSKTMLSQLIPNSKVYEARNGLEAIEQYQSITKALRLT